MGRIAYTTPTFGASHQRLLIRVHNNKMTAAAHPQSLLVQMLDPAVRADPYPVYDQIRTQGPIQLPGNNLTVFASYAHCDEVLRHPCLLYTSPSPRD